MVEALGVEPRCQACKASILPLNDAPEGGLRGQATKATRRGVVEWAWTPRVVNVVRLWIGVGVGVGTTSSTMWAVSTSWTRILKLFLEIARLLLASCGGGLRVVHTQYIIT